MNSFKATAAAGFAFAACGIAFLLVGLFAHASVFSALGTSFLALGVVLFAESRAREARSDIHER